MGLEPTIFRLKDESISRYAYGGKVPRRGLEPRRAASKAAGLPLADPGKHDGTGLDVRRDPILAPFGRT